MNFFPSKRVVSRALAFGVACCVSTPGFAVNGYFLIGYGAKTRSMGGAGVAYGQDGLAGAANPAAMADVDVTTMRVDAGAELFVPKRAFVNDSLALESNFPGSDQPVQHRSGANEYLIPSMGMIYKFNRKLTVGMAAIGNGAGTRYHQQVPGKPNCIDGDFSDGTGSTGFNFNCLGSPNAGVSLIQMQLLPGLAYEVSKNHTVGLSLTLAAQQFRAFGLQAFGLQDDPRTPDPNDKIGLGFGATDSDLTNRGNDYSYGAGVRVGWLGKFFDERLSLGANYASRTYMTRFDKYRNLFAEQGAFDVPEHWTVGIAVKPIPKLTMAFDFQKIYYSDIKSIGNPGPDVANPANFFPTGCVAQPDGSNSCSLGQDDGLGFGWKDVEAFKVGINYDHNSKWSFRAGYNYAESPIQDDQVLFNFLAPAVSEQHVTAGLSYRPSPNVEWSANYMHAFNNTIKGPTALGPNGNQPVVGENASIDMRIDSFGISFGYKL